MTKQEFISYLSAPEKLNGRSIAALEKLVQEYPYFQIGRLLYLKNLYNEKSIDYEKNLHITTAYVPSGKILYNLIKGTEVRNPKETKIESPASDESLLNNILEKPAPLIEPIIALQEESIVKEDISTPNVINDEPDEMQLLEKQMLREVYRTSMTIDILEPDQHPANPCPTIREGLLTTDYQQPQSDRRSVIVNNQSHSFTEWMKIITGKPLESFKETSAAYPSLTRQVKTEIVENYILEETSKLSIKPKAEFYSADAMAKKSLVDNETFVTETLAKIYLKQGNLPKALRSYEILLIKYPEKVHIFAPLLEKIKNLLEQQKKKIN